MKYLLIALLIFCAMPVQAAKQSYSLNGSALTTHCTRATQFLANPEGATDDMIGGFALCMGIVRGVLDTTALTLAIYGDALYCLPAEENIAGIMKSAVRYAKTQTRAAKLPAGVVFLMSLHHNYPCSPADPELNLAFDTVMGALWETVK